MSRGDGFPPISSKAILRACYAEIDEVWARFRHGQAIIRQPELPPKILRGEGLARWIWRISRIEGGLMPDTATLDRNGVKPSTLVRFWGGHGIMAQHFHITTDSLVPFFLAIAIQTAANPEPLRLIRRDCLVPHPLDEHRIILDWCKPKTGLRLKRAQRGSFDRRRRHAAPNLVEMMLALTEPIVAHAPPGQRDRLFLTRSVYEKLAHRTRRGRVEVIEPSVLARTIGGSSSAPTAASMPGTSRIRTTRKPGSSVSPRSCCAAASRPRIIARRAVTFWSRSRS
ncbi:MAG: hypothetical protein HC871_14485 [Rhizobiales bacterium]|nr:hypothetical protein [Hyphomicrobiales bacterium]